MSEQALAEENEAEESEPEIEETEPPDMSEDMADDVDNFAQKIEAETSPESDSEGWGDETLEIGDEEISMGDVYCNLLTVLANESVKNMGSGEAPFEKADGELDTTLAKQLDLDTYFNQVMAKRSKSELSPEQALVFSTLLFVGAVFVTDPQLMNNAIGGVRRDKNDG